MFIFDLPFYIPFLIYDLMAHIKEEDSENYQNVTHQERNRKGK